jgi:ATP-dependent DNA ligase
MVTLYKRDKKGKVRAWTIEHDAVSYWTISGIHPDGKMTKTAPTFVEQKNVGKANETSLEQQVELEVKSKIQYQIDHGFTYEIPAEEREFAVSLADKYVDRLEKGKVDFPYVIEPKLDGVRCYIKLVDGKATMWSRGNKEFKSVPHLAENRFITEFFKKYPDAILDGELYNHALKNDFNKIVSLVKKTKPTAADLEESKKIVEYHCFDSYYPSEPELNYVQRKVKVGEIVSDIRGADVIFNETFVACEEVKIVGLFLVQQKENNEYGWWLNVAQTEEKVDEYLENQLKLGYEGIMLKKFDVPYFFGRSFDMLKYKRFKDAEYKIVDIEDGKGNKKGKATAVICVDDNGTEFKAGVTGTEEFAAEMFANKETYIGKVATIKYQELTPMKDGKGGVPRFGKMTAIRDYES